MQSYLAASHKIFAQHLLTLSTSHNKIAQSYYDQNPTLILQILFSRFDPWNSDFQISMR